MHRVVDMNSPLERASRGGERPMATTIGPGTPSSWLMDVAGRAAVVPQSGTLYRHTARDNGAPGRWPASCKW